jgi:ribosomal protein L37AE/L43A
MFKLELRMPVQALQCEAALERLSKTHPLRSTIEKDLKKWLKGYNGEKEVGYYLSILPDEQYYIFHGLRLQDKKYFQMDIVLLSPRFILIIEVKNIAGRIIFKKGSNHVVRIYDQQEEGMDNPIYQVVRQHQQLRNWLNTFNIRAIPIEHVVVFSNTSTIIETTPDNQGIFQNVIYAEALLEKISELETKYQHIPLLSHEKLNLLSDLLLKEHTIHISDFFQTYKLTKNELSTGVQCPTCQTFSMQYISGSWRCQKCKCSSKTAHQKAVEDYFLLLHPTITRKEFAEFLQIDSITKAKNLLLALQLPSTGSKRGTRYFLEKNCIFSP